MKKIIALLVFLMLLGTVCEVLAQGPTPAMLRAQRRQDRENARQAAEGIGVTQPDYSVLDAPLPRLLPPDDSAGSG